MQLNDNHHKASPHNHLTELLPTKQSHWPFFSVYFIKSFIALQQFLFLNLISFESIVYIYSPMFSKEGLLSSSVLCPWVTQHHVCGVCERGSSQQHLRHVSLRTFATCSFKS